MKTTKRSKMLLSSIAMLLVALVALGSATYAWYVVNKTVTASSLTVQAKTATGLVGAKTSNAATWGKDVALTATTAEALSPASISVSANPTYIVNAAGTDTDDGTFKAGQTGLTDTALNLSSSVAGAYLADDFYIKSESGTVSNVKIQVQSTSQTGGYLNCLVFVDGTYAGGSCIDEDVTTTTAKLANGTAGTAPTLSALNTDCYTISSVTTSPKHIQIVCYADGENGNCQNSTVKPDPASFTVYCYYN